MTTVTERPTAFQVAGRAWKSTFLAMGQMAPLFLSCLSVLLAISFAGDWLGQHPVFKPTPEQEAWLKHPAGPSPFPVWQTFPATAFWEVANCIILAPVAVAVHRFVLLGEVRKGILYISPVTLRFAGLAALFAVLQIALNFYGFTASSLVRTVLDIAYWSCAMWTLLAFPSIAVEESFSGIARQLDAAIGRVKGNFWLVVRTMLMTVFVIFLAIAIYSVSPFFNNPEALQNPLAVSEHYFGWPFAVATTAAMVLMVALGAAAASWLYSYTLSKEGLLPGFWE